MSWTISSNKWIMKNYFLSARTTKKKGSSADVIPMIFTCPTVEWVIFSSVHLSVHLCPITRILGVMSWGGLDRLCPSHYKESCWSPHQRTALSVWCEVANYSRYQMTFCHNCDSHLHLRLTLHEFGWNLLRCLDVVISYNFQHMFIVNGV